LVDRERILARIQRVEELVTVLEGVRRGGEERVLGDRHVQLQTERALQVAIQACIDIGAQLVAERGLPAPDDYRGVFERLEGAGMLDRRLARQLGDAAGLRNILVHGYLDVDPARLWSSLTELDDLRAFCAAVGLLLEDEAGSN